METRDENFGDKIFEVILPGLFKFIFRLPEYLRLVYCPDLLKEHGGDEPHEFEESFARIIVCTNSPPTPVIRCKQVYSSIKELLNRVIEAKLRKPEEKNILTAGFRASQENNQANNGMKDMFRVDCFYPNTLLNFLKSKFWRSIHLRIGDSAFVHIISNCSVFSPLSGGNYLQVCGCPIYEMFDSKNPTHGLPSCGLSSTVPPKLKPPHSNQPQKPPYLTRSSILYASNHSQRISQNFILEMHPATIAGSRSLIQKVFSLKSSSSSTQK
eukprot:Sdes_comp22704_c0_seq1m21120